MNQIGCILLILALVLFGKFINTIPIPEVAVFVWVAATFGTIAGVFYLLRPRQNNQ